MEGSIRLTAQQRKTALQISRSNGDARVARRAHILLLLAAGHSYRQIMETLFASSDLVAGARRRFLVECLEAALAEPDADRTVPYWQLVVAGWVLEKTPRDFGYFRSRWTCQLLAELLGQRHGMHLSGETVRRGLQKLGFVWRRPRSVVGPVDPDYEAKLRRIGRLLATLPAGEVAVFQDEVDVHLNPKISDCWMKQAEQTTVPTPGNNVNRHVAGSLVCQTGILLVSPPGMRRNAGLFLAHLDDLRRPLWAYCKIHVICDNAAFHRCRAVWEYLARWGHRIQLHFLPTYAPETNPIERVWWHLHETITRNHRCRSINQLLELDYDWFTTNNNFCYDMRNSLALAA